MYIYITVMVLSTCAVVCCMRTEMLCLIQQMDSMRCRTCCSSDKPTLSYSNLHSVLKLCKNKKKKPHMILFVYFFQNRWAFSPVSWGLFGSLRMITAAVKSYVYHSTTLLRTTRVLFAFELLLNTLKVGCCFSVEFSSIEMSSVHFGLCCGTVESTALYYIILYQVFSWSRPISCLTYISLRVWSLYHATSINFQMYLVWQTIKKSPLRNKMKCIFYPLYLSLDFCCHGLLRRQL